MPQYELCGPAVSHTRSLAPIPQWSPFGTYSPVVTLWHIQPSGHPVAQTAQWSHTAGTAGPHCASVAPQLTFVGVVWKCQAEPDSVQGVGQGGGRHPRTGACHKPPCNSQFPMVVSQYSFVRVVGRQLGGTACPPCMSNHSTPTTRHQQELELSWNTLTMKHFKP
jgi:hypothetical protein